MKKILIVPIILIIMFMWWLAQHQLFFARTTCGKMMVDYKGDRRGERYTSCVNNQFFVWHGIHRFNH
jgi:hypothetical protein